MIGVLAAATFLISSAFVALRIAEGTIGAPVWVHNIFGAFHWKALVLLEVALHDFLADILSLSILSSPMWQMASLWLLFLSQRAMIPLPSLALIWLCQPGLILLVAIIIWSTAQNLYGVFIGRFSWLVLSSDVGAALIAGLIFPRLRLLGLLYDWALESGPGAIWGRSRGSTFE